VPNRKDRKMYLLAYSTLTELELRTATFIDQIFVESEDGIGGYPQLFKTADEADAYREDNEIDSIIIEIPVNENTK